MDDEPSICLLVTRWLQAEKYRCEAASSAEEALELLSSQDFELVVSDITMPGKSGMELLEAIHRTFPSTGVVMMTAVDDRSTAIEALRLGAYGYVIKPFDQNEMVINVANALERQRLVQASERYQHHLEEEIRKRTAEIRFREEEIALRLVSAVEFRDVETGDHNRRIGLFSAALAAAIGWETNRVDEIRVAASMHDIGKIGVPDSILLKPGPLSAEEFEIVKRHPEIGAAILSGSDVPLIQLAKEIALSHHEKWDGSGYPRGFSGKMIPESGRIVAIVDVYDALTQDRVYRPAMAEAEALRVMTEDCNRHFDPDLFDVFIGEIPRFQEIRTELASRSGPNNRKGQARTGE